MQRRTLPAAASLLAGFLSLAASGLSAADKAPLRFDSGWAAGTTLFSANMPEGNYRVTMTFGGVKEATDTTIRAESRRLMLESVKTSPGETTQRTFMVNVRHRQLGNDQVQLKKSELTCHDWDDQLTFEINGAHPALKSIEITPIGNAITVYIAGDSTVVDMDKEPYSAWGQMLPRFFRTGVVIANHAESGESLKSFMAAKRLDKILSTMKAGDYFFIQFAHNDQKPGEFHVDPFTTYKETLTHYIDEARKRGATPVLVTSMHRRTFGDSGGDSGDDSGKITNSLGDYPEAMRQTAKEQNVALIDLNAMSKVFYEALGREQSKRAFVHYPAHTFPGQEEELKDNSHFSAYGAYQLARGVVAGIRTARLGIAEYLLDDVPPIDPAHPDPIDGFHLPVSPLTTNVAPDGK